MHMLHSKIHKAILAVVGLFSAALLPAQAPRNCHIYQILNGDTASKTLVAVQTFDVLGRMTQEIHQNFKYSVGSVGTTDTTDFVYQDTMLVEKRLRYGNGEGEKWVFIHNALGQVVTEEIYTYDPSLKPESASNDGGTPDDDLEPTRRWGLALKIHYSYNPQGQNVRQKSHSYSGLPSFRWKKDFQYDRKGRLSHVITYPDSNSNAFTDEIYSYAAHSKTVRSIRYDDQGNRSFSESRRTETFDLLGRPIRDEFQVSVSSEYKSATTYTYQGTRLTQTVMTFTEFVPKTKRILQEDQVRHEYVYF
jgi:hypothetical protein